MSIEEQFVIEKANARSALEAIKEYAEQLGIDPKEELEDIIADVFGDEVSIL